MGRYSDAMTRAWNAARKLRVRRRSAGLPTDPDLDRFVSTSGHGRDPLASKRLRNARLRREVARRKAPETARRGV